MLDVLTIWMPFTCFVGDAFYNDLDHKMFNILATILDQRPFCRERFVDSNCVLNVSKILIFYFIQKVGKISEVPCCLHLGQRPEKLGTNDH